MVNYFERNPGLVSIIKRFVHTINIYIRTYICGTTLTHAQSGLERSFSVFGFCRKTGRNNAIRLAHAQKRHGADRVPGADQALTYIRGKHTIDISFS